MADGQNTEESGENAKPTLEELEHVADGAKEEVEELEAKKVFDVVFNEKYPVKIHGKNQTGLSLKQAAISQGVPIQLDFVLSIELGGGKTDLIGDNQPFKVKAGDRFLAIPNDDNS